MQQIQKFAAKEIVCNKKQSTGTVNNEAIQEAILVQVKFEA